MGLHHTQIRKAEKAGFQLAEDSDSGKVRAFWPKRGLAIYGNSGADAIAQMQAAMAILTNYEDYRITTDAEYPRLVFVQNGDGFVLNNSPMPPVAAHKVIFTDKNAEWGGFDVRRDAVEAEEPVIADELAKADAAEDAKPKAVERINGVATDGAIAYQEGTPAGDCPFDNESDDPEEQERADAWYTAWDEAADAAEPEAEEGVGGSVVASKYRAKYAELGHPTHCGDWLAELLNNLCIHGKGTDLDQFERICSMNGVDLSKYNRESKGWQGRFRMTGRNLLAKRVYMAGGILKAINAEGVATEYRAPAEWMQAQRFNMPKSEQSKPIPQPEHEAA